MIIIYGGYVFNSKSKQITSMARSFLELTDPTNRQYKALRAYFVEGLCSGEVTHRFGYAAASFRVLWQQFRQNPQRGFFLPPQKGPHASPRTDRMREKVVAFQKQNLSIYDISRALESAGQRMVLSQTTNS